MEPPCVSAVETSLVEPRLLPFRKEEKSPRIVVPELGEDICPEVLGNLESDIAAESVNASIQPEAHALLHLRAHVFIGIVQLGYIRPVIFNDGFSLRVTDIP